MNREFFELPLNIIFEELKKYEQSVKHVENNKKGRNFITMEQVNDIRKKIKLTLQEKVQIGSRPSCIRLENIRKY